MAKNIKAWGVALVCNETTVFGDRMLPLGAIYGKDGHGVFVCFNPRKNPHLISRPDKQLLMVKDNHALIGARIEFAGTAATQTKNWLVILKYRNGVHDYIQKRIWCKSYAEAERVKARFMRNASRSNKDTGNRVVWKTHYEDNDTTDSITYVSAKYGNKVPAKSKARVSNKGAKEVASSLGLRNGWQVI